MDSPDKKRCILITGASRGIGKSLASLRLAAGDEVILLSRTKPPLDILGKLSHDYQVDLSDRQMLAAAMRNILDKHPNVDAVVSNAGDGTCISRLEQMNFEQIEQHLRTNLLSHIWLTRSLWPHLRRQEKAHLVFVGSEAALRGADRGSIYCAAKFGLRGFAQSLRIEAASRPLNVSIVHPGPVRSDFFNTLDFEPGPSDRHATKPETVAKQISWIIDAPSDCVIDELVVSPPQRVFMKRKSPPTARE